MAEGLVEVPMWIDAGVTAMAILALAAMARWCRTTDGRRADAGSISRRWLAEHNPQRHDPQW